MIEIRAKAAVDAAVDALDEAQHQAPPLSVEPAASSTALGVLADARVAEAFVALADTLDVAFTPTGLLGVLVDRCVDVLAVSAAGVLVSDAHGDLQVAAASSHRARLLGMFEVDTSQGPGMDCFRTGLPTSFVDTAAAGCWPRFAAATGEVGFAAVHAMPLRLRAEVIGSLNLYNVEPGAIDQGRLRLGQALADVATIGLLQRRAIQDREVLADQLRTALRSRVVIERAKGVLAERLHIGVADAFVLLRDVARSHNRRLSDFAQAVIDGTEGLTPAAARMRAGGLPVVGGRGRGR